MGLSSENVWRSWLAFDIETCPMPTCAEYLTDPIEAPSNYKDPAKIAAYVEEKRKQQIEHAALDLDLCEIVAIAVDDGSGGDPAVVTRREKDERALLEWFWRMAREKTLVGFNCLGFDLPVLLRRSLYLNVLTPHVNVDRYRHEGVIDLADVLTFNGKTKWRSLAFYCKRFGLPFDSTIDGEQIPAMVAEGKWDLIARHAAADVSGTTALALRIGAVYAPESVAR